MSKTSLRVTGRRAKAGSDWSLEVLMGLWEDSLGTIITK